MIDRERIGYTCDVINEKEVVLNLSEKCNNFCLNCPNDDRFRQDTIEPAEVTDFLNRRISNVTERVTFIGGEPTILPNLFDIIRHIRTLNPRCTIQINSNGRMFYYTKFVDNFRGFSNLEFHIALYASGAKLHDKITQRKQSFEQTVEGIHNLIRFELHTDVRIIINKLNYKDLPSFAEFIVNNFPGVNKVIFVGMDIIGNAYKNRRQLAVSHLNSAPFIEKAIDLLGDLKKEIHMIPKGFFRSRYFHLAEKSGCVGGNFVDSFGCHRCIYSDDCCKLSKSYSVAFGTQEHYPILSGR